MNKQITFTLLCCATFTVYAASNEDKEREIVEAKLRREYPNLLPGSPSIAEAISAIRKFQNTPGENPYPVFFIVAGATPNSGFTLSRTLPYPVTIYENDEESGEEDDEESDIAAPSSEEKSEDKAAQ